MACKAFASVDAVPNILDPSLATLLSFVCATSIKNRLHFQFVDRIKVTCIRVALRLFGAEYNNNQNLPKRPVSRTEVPTCMISQGQ